MCWDVLPQIDVACCCLSIRHGTILVGVLSAIYSVMLLFNAFDIFGVPALKSLSISTGVVLGIGCFLLYFGVRLYKPNPNYILGYLWIALLTIILTAVLNLGFAWMSLITRDVNILMIIWYLVSGLITMIVLVIFIIIANSMRMLLLEEGAEGLSM